MIHIMANGVHNRFADGNKMLLPVWGEPVIRRTCRILHDEGFDVMVHTCDPVTRAWVEDLVIVRSGMDPLEGFLQEEFNLLRRYGGEAVTIILYGDVVWDVVQLVRVVKCEKAQIFGSKDKHGGEGFAMVCLREDIAYMTCCYEAAIKQVSDENLTNSGWLMSRRWMGIEPKTVAYNDKMFTDIGGWTMDFDYATDYEYFKKKVEPYNAR